MPTNSRIRTFVCVEVSAAARERIEQLQHRLARSSAEVSWVKKANLHLTLKFLGEIPQAQVERAGAVLKEVAAGRSCFELQFGGTGSFPHARNPRILWVGLVQGLETLKELQHAVDTGLSTAGFARETRPFTPHLTIGRVKSGRNAAPLVQALLAAGFHSAPFRVSELVLMRSELKSSGAVYTPLQVFDLKE